MIKKIFFTIFIATILTFSFSANASILSLKTTNNKLIVNQVFRIDLLVNTEDKNINAIESYLKFDSNMLELQKIYSGNSSISIWVKQPRSQGDEIFFSGITPGGINISNGKIISALFVAKKTGITTIEINKAKVLLNNDNATEDVLKINNILLEITEKPLIIPNKPIANKDETPKENPIVSEEQEDEGIDLLPKDITRPDEFNIKIIKDLKINNGQFSIIFYAQDKDSGISHYEVKEGDDDFKKIESPYLLNNQDLTKEIQIKAVDNEGNYRIQSIGPLIIIENKGYFNYKIIIISLLFIIFVLILLEAYLNRRKNKNENKDNI